VESISEFFQSHPSDVKLAQHGFTHSLNKSFYPVRVPGTRYSNDPIAPPTHALPERVGYLGDRLDRLFGFTHVNNYLYFDAFLFWSSVMVSSVSAHKTNPSLQG